MDVWNTGHAGGPSLKNSKSISGFGWALTILDPKFYLISVLFQLDYTNFYEFIAWYHGFTTKFILE